MLSVPPAMMALRRSALDAIGGKRDGLQPRGAESVDGHRRRFDGQPGAKARDARDVQPLLGFGHRAAEDDVFDVGRRHAWRAIQRFAHDGRGELVGPRRRSDPFGALPTGVRTAETMRPQPSKSCSRSSMASPTSDDLAVEQMIGAVDDDELFRLGQLRVELPDLLQRNQLVALAMNEERRLARPSTTGEVIVTVHRAGDADERRDVGIRRRRPSSPTHEPNDMPPVQTRFTSGYRAIMKSSAARKSSCSPGRRRKTPRRFGRRREN